MVIPSQKALRQLEANRHRKRGGGRVRGDSVFAGADLDAAGIEAVADQKPTPAFAAQLEEQFHALTDQLGDASLRQLALLKLQGFSNEEIARRLD